MATDFSQLTPEQQSAIAKFAAATYGTSPKALGMVQQKLAADPSYANQQLQRFGYKVGVDTSGVNEFNPLAEGMSYDQDIRASLAAGEQETATPTKAPPSGKAAPASGSKGGSRGGATTADGSIPVPKSKPGQGPAGLDANGTVEDASKKAAPSDDPSTFAANATEAALAAGAGGAALAAGMHIGDKLSSRGAAAAVPPPVPAADEDMIQMIMRASGAAPALPAQAAAGALPPPPAALPAPQGPVGPPPSPTDDMVVKSMMASGAGQTDQAGMAMRLKGLINQTGSPEAAVQMMLQQREYPPELILDMARQVGVQLPGGTPMLPDASRAAAKAIPRP